MADFSSPSDLVESLRALKEQWSEEAERLRLRKGQMTREKRGHEVLLNCALALDLLLQEQARGAQQAISRYEPRHFIGPSEGADRLIDRDEMLAVPPVSERRERTKVEVIEEHIAIMKDLGASTDVIAIAEQVRDDYMREQAAGKRRERTDQELPSERREREQQEENVQASDGLVTRDCGCQVMKGWRCPVHDQP